MEYKEIVDLTIKWDSMVSEIMDLKPVDIEQLKTLFETTHELLKKYIKDRLVPKEMCELLLQVQEWLEFTSVVQDSQYCEYYGSLLKIVHYLLKGFVKGELDDERFKETLNLLN